jgi:hypothetical protein
MRFIVSSKSATIMYTAAMGTDPGTAKITSEPMPSLDEVPYLPRPFALGGLQYQRCLFCFDHRAGSDEFHLGYEECCIATRMSSEPNPGLRSGGPGIREPQSVMTAWRPTHTFQLGHEGCRIATTMPFERGPGRTLGRL